jgi:hypothetical protein
MILRNEIIFKCQRTFLPSEEYDKKVKDLEEKLKSMEGMDDETRAHIERGIQRLKYFIRMVN